MYLLPRDTTASIAEFAKRQFYSSSCRYGYNRYGNCNSAWNRWGRWVLAGILIFIGVMFLLGFMFCASRRRRRARRATPMTYQAPATGYNQGYNNQPQYGAPAGPPPNYGGEQYNGYYGQQSGVAQPANTYKP